MIHFINMNHLIHISSLLFCTSSIAELFLPSENILGVLELQGPNVYSYKDLKSATDNFSKENKLGEGAFGEVYKVQSYESR